MARRQIFISHSAHRDPSARPVLDLLEAKLNSQNRDYTVLLDHSTLQPGEDWRSALNIWCGACDAAILLITPDSMVAEFCNYEWSILAYRKATSQNFKILPVYYGATPEDLRGKPHQISEIQGSVVFSTIENSWPPIETWLGKVVTNEGPAARQAQLLATLFRTEIQDPYERNVNHAMSKINLPFGTWDPLADPWERFALLLISLGLKNATPALAELRWAFDGKEDRWNDILDLVACSWVDNRSTERLLGRTGGLYGERAVALNAEQGETARLYVVKASGRPPSYAWCTAAVTEVAADVEALKSQIEVSLARALRLDTSPAVNRTRLAEKLRNKETARQPVVVYLRANSLDRVWLAELRQRFEFVTFFLLSGPERPALTDVEWMEPELPPGFETTFWNEYDASKDAFQ
ncbi:MAG TPA: toll/interleukin-1 receptor domain-containing protein [Bryobacteraceae bacterium]